MNEYVKYINDWQKNGYPYTYQVDTKTWTLFGLVILTGFLTAIYFYAYTKTLYTNE